MYIIMKQNKGGINMAELTAEEKAIKNREAVKKCMKNKDRINVILPQGTLDRINAYGLKTNAFARELILAELDRMDKMKKIINESFTPSKELIEAMGIKEGWMNRWPSELSGGELQRFCVIRALSRKTKFLIADEMTTMLDAITQAQIWNVVLDYARKNDIGVVVISHEKALVEKICDRVVNLEEFKEEQKEVV